MMAAARGIISWASRSGMLERVSSIPSERRSEPDRRKAARGGRRPTDKPGFTPLVLVVGSGEESRSESEAILAALKFAVTPARDVAEALRVLESLGPDLIVATAEDATRLRGTGAPVVEYDRNAPGDAALIEAVRAAIRKAR